MRLQKIMAVMLCLALSSVALGAEPKPEKKFFSYKDANGNLVFSDKQDEGGDVLQIRKPSVVTDSQLGKKVQYAPVPRGNYSKHPQVLERERMEAKCAKMADAVYATSGARGAYRRDMSSRYDRECVGNGY